MDKCKLLLPMLSLLLLFLFTQCSKKESDIDMPEENDIDMPKIDFSNIEKLYELPLPVIQKCVQGKWQWYVSCGGVAGCQYDENTFVDINEDNYVIYYADGTQRSSDFTWVKLYLYIVESETYAMKSVDGALWYFTSIINDSLRVYSLSEPNDDFPFREGFIRIK